MAELHEYFFEKVERKKYELEYVITFVHVLKKGSNVKFEPSKIYPVDLFVSYKTTLEPKAKE